jgi:hypothetical protein
MQISFGATINFSRLSKMWLPLPPVAKLMKNAWNNNAPNEMQKSGKPAAIARLFLGPTDRFGRRARFVGKCEFCLPPTLAENYPDGVEVG